MRSSISCFLIICYFLFTLIFLPTVLSRKNQRKEIVKSFRYFKIACSSSNKSCIDPFCYIKNTRNDSTFSAGCKHLNKVYKVNVSSVLCHLKNTTKYINNIFSIWFQSAIASWPTIDMFFHFPKSSYVTSQISPKIPKWEYHCPHFPTTLSPGTLPYLWSNIWKKCTQRRCIHVHLKALNSNSTTFLHQKRRRLSHHCLRETIDISTPFTMMKTVCCSKRKFTKSLLPVKKLSFRCSRLAYSLVQCCQYTEISGSYFIFLLPMIWIFDGNKCVKKGVNIYTY